MANGILVWPLITALLALTLTFASSIRTRTMVAVGREFYGALSKLFKKKAPILTESLMARAVDRFVLRPPKVLPLERPAESPAIISVAQFRPEKAHSLQLEAFSAALKKLDAELPRPKLQFVGSCQNKSDEERLQNLKDKATELKVDGDVEFHKNLMDLVKLLGSAVVGIHSMIDEHFGMCVVEYMAAGAIPIAHNSAGPKMDIVLEEDGQQTGFLAQNAEEYADAIAKIISMPETLRLKMAAAARQRASRFFEQRFYEDFKAAIKPVLCHATNRRLLQNTTHLQLKKLYESVIE